MPSETLKWMLRMSDMGGALQHIRNKPLAGLSRTTEGQAVRSHTAYGGTRTRTPTRAVPLSGRPAPSNS
jgi:hypothetical protein